MPINELLASLRYRSEGTDLDFKSSQYRFAHGTDYEKSEILKDILAMANAWRDGPGYILLGLKDRRPHLAEVVGISENIDDSKLQQFVNSKVKPKLTFRYEEHLYEGKTVGVIEIPKQKRPFFLANTYGKLKNNIAYVRRGSSTEEAEPTEVAEMALADSGRSHAQLDLSVLTSENEPLPDAVELTYLRFPKKLPDYASEPETSDSYGISVRSCMWHDNSDYWREYAEYLRVTMARVEIKFVLKNLSVTTLSNAKLEISVTPQDGQSFHMLAGADIPDEPSAQWSTLSNVRGLSEILEQREARFTIDEDGTHPVCRVRFGSLHPGEDGRSSDSLIIVPHGPGRLQLHFRIFAAELDAPQKSERMLEAKGESKSIDFDGLESMRGQALLARYLAEEGKRQGE